MIPFKSS